MIVLPIRLRDEATQVRNRRRRKYWIGSIVLGVLWGISRHYGVPGPSGWIQTWIPIVLGMGGLTSFFLAVRQAPPPQASGVQASGS